MNSLLIVEAKSLRLPATTKPGWAAAPKKATFAIGSCWCSGENLGTPQKIWWQCGKSRKRNYKLVIVIGSYGENVGSPKLESTLT